MVIGRNKAKMHQVLLDNGRVTIDADAPKEYGGDGYVFGPHDFIEAGLAACMNGVTRFMCEQRGVKYDQIVTKIDLNHDDEKTTVIRCGIEIVGGCPAEEAEKVRRDAFNSCLVKQTLSKEMNFIFVE